MSKTMLLIDADNVSTDVMEQAVQALLLEHGALHVRRAYCTAESALKHQALFKRLGIRPMVNLSAGKNSTDIALAVDALDLVLSERPDVVAIASSDSDFAPLVGRLREKGCRVVGIGQQGKTGDATQAVYDAFTVLSHRRSTASPAPASAPARKTATRRAVAAKAAPKALPTDDAPAAPVPAPAGRAAAAPARKTTRRQPAAKGGTTAAESGAPAARTRAASGRTITPAPAAVGPTADVATSAAKSVATPAPDTLRRILMAMPELVRGDTVELRVAADRLRESGLLSKNGASTKVFGAFGDRFELVPARNPNKVRLRA